MEQFFELYGNLWSIHVWHLVVEQNQLEHRGSALAVIDLLDSLLNYLDCILTIEHATRGYLLGLQHILDKEDVHEVIVDD